MVTLHRRAQQHEKHDPGISYLTLAFNAGVAVGVILSLIVRAWLWR